MIFSSLCFRLIELAEYHCNTIKKVLVWLLTNQMILTEGVDLFHYAAVFSVMIDYDVSFYSTVKLPGLSSLQSG